MFQSPGRATVAELRARCEAYGQVTRAKRVDHNTMEAEYADGSRVILLHHTPILTFPKHGGFVVNTGGYATPTTRDRLNKYLPDGWQVTNAGGWMRLARPAANAADYRQRWAEAKAKARGLPKPEESKGDPWVFSPAQLDRETVEDWLDSLYWTRRLYLLALEYAGISPQGIVLYLHAADRAGGKLSKTDWGRVRRLLRAKMGGVRK